MDINTTFPLNEKFCAYNRSLSLVAAVDVKTGKIKHEISAKDIKGCFVAESLRCVRSTVELAIYNKKKEMQNKGEALVTEELMRVEHRLTSRSAIIGNLKTDQLKDICEILHISLKSAYRLIHNGEIPSIKIGQHYRISKRALGNFINADE